MAIERMYLLNIIGHKDDFDTVSKRIVLSKSFHLIDAYKEINTTNFKIKATKNNIPMLIDVSKVKHYAKNTDFTRYKKDSERLTAMSRKFGSTKVPEKELIFDSEVIQSEIEKYSETIKDSDSRLKALEKSAESIKKYIRAMNYLKGLNINAGEISNLKNINFKVLKLTKESVLRIKENDENIPSIFISAYVGRENDIVLAFTPCILMERVRKIFNSLQAEVVETPQEISGTPLQVISFLKEKLMCIEKEKKRVSSSVLDMIKKDKRKIDILTASMHLEIKSEEVKDTSACTSEFFYICGWIPQSLLDVFRKKLNDVYGKLIIIKEDSSEVKQDIVVPTKLRNNKFAKPFEAIVNLYGVPSYNEIDPTFFLSITYMIFFGAMFGDLGQGLVFLAAGLFLKYKKSRPNLGGVFARIGISSSIFGCLYGSFFGFENVIKPILIRPMKNITTMLVYSIAFGCILIFIGFILGIVNFTRNSDVENGLFGKTGVAGLMLFISMLGIVSNIVGFKFISLKFWGIAALLMLILIILKQPLGNLIIGKRPLFIGGKKDYLVEQCFGTIEVIISLISNTISFIRIGAFAINHVGLFMVFSIIAHLIQNGAGSAFVYILGNVIIIGLEGLIVFIQSLRLEFYELFSKYYEGSGVSFNPIS